MIWHGRIWAPRLGESNFLQRDFREPDWSAALASFDAVVTLQAVHEVRHVTKVPALLAQARQCLFPSGILLCCDHYFAVGKNPELLLDRGAQLRAIAGAGFTAVERLLDQGGMALYRAPAS
jgi:hypothetical protein